MAVLASAVRAVAGAVADPFASGAWWLWLLLTSSAGAAGLVQQTLP